MAEDVEVAAARVRAHAASDPLFVVLSLVLEARIAAGLGDALVVDRAVERAAELLVDLL